MINKIKSKFSSSLVNKGLKDSSYYMIANFGTKALGFVVIPILARTVSVESFANYDLFLIITAFLQLIVTLGMDSGLAILMAESKDDDTRLSFYYVSILVISLVFLVLLLLALNSSFLFFDSLFSLSQDYWILISIYIIFTLINYHTFNFLRWRAEAKKAAFINLFSYVIGIALGLTFMYYNQSIFEYIKGLVIGSFLGAIVSLYFARNFILNFTFLDDAKKLLFELLKLSLPFVPNYLGNNLIQVADRVIIAYFLGKEELGLYAVIMRLAMIPQFIAGTVTGGFLPVMYNNYKSIDGRRLIRKFFHFYIISIPTIMIFAYFVSDLVVHLFAGEEYVKIAYLFPIALASILLINSTQANGFGYTIMRKTQYIMYFTFLSLVINVALSVVLGLWLGIAGVILGTLLAGCFRTLIHTKYSEKFYSFDYSFVLMYSVLSIVLILSILIFRGGI